MLKYLTLAGITYFFYWLIKHKLRQRKLAQQGIVIQEKGLRPITLLSLVVLVSYGGYALYYALTGQASH